MKRVGIDGHMLGDHSGGNEVFYSNILKHMEVPEDMEIILFVKPGTDVSEYETKFKVVYFKSKRAFIRNFIELTFLCIKYKLDVLHVQYFIPFIRPCKVIVTIHDICFEHFKDIFTKKEYIRQKILIPYAARKADSIVTVSEFSKDDIASHYNISRDKISVVYNAVSEKFRILPKDELNREELLQKYHIPNEKFILSVCNLQPRKNIPRLIKAFVKLKEQGLSEKLVLVGKKAWMYSEIDDLLSKYPDDIFITGYVEEDDLIRFYNACELFVYPSIFEGFGIPPLEAMACGSKVAISHITSLQEVVGDVGVYFNPFDIDYMAEVVDKLINERAESCQTADIDDQSMKSTRQKEIANQMKKYCWRISAEKIKGEYLLVSEKMI